MSHARYLRLPKIAPWQTAVLVAGAAFLWRLAAGPHPVDDAYITFRYAANMARGAGFVYNPGEPILGTSTPAMGLLLAASAAAFGTTHVPIMSLVWNALFDASCVILLAAIARRLGFPPLLQWLAAGLYGFAPLVVRYSIGGMEAPLATAVSLLAIYLFFAERPVAAALLAGLGVLVRPDILAVGAALAGAQLVVRDRRVGRTVLILVGCLAAAGGLLFAFYGSPLPQSVLAKASPIYQSTPFASAVEIAYALGSFPLLYGTGIGAKGLLVSTSPMLTLTAVILFAVGMAFWALGIRDLIRRNSQAMILALYPSIFMGTYVLAGLRGSLVAEWYTPPLLAVWMLAWLHGLWLTLHGLQLGSARWAGLGLAVVLMVTEMAGFDLGRGRQANAWMPLSVWEERELLYLRAAEDLRPRIGAADVVAASEIGAFGYACGCRILDTVGLVSRVSLGYYPLPAGRYSTNYAIPSELIRDQRPRFLVTLEVFARDTLLRDARFLGDYELVWEAPTDAFGSRGLQVYQRIPLR
ncbi:MAG TPA: hypothetical protein VLD63_13070 [Anaerolineales bacterium]|nr:hypothetical protein [Anaerolineales bacterium]